jgi:hypothetical protein
MKRKNEDEEQLNPEQLCVAAFSRCSNWPNERLGQIGLAQGLAKACADFGQDARAVVAKCKELSAFCPTDFDLLAVARDMRDEQRRAKPAREYMHTPKCALCGDSGWQPCYWLHTRVGGKVRKEEITAESAAAFWAAAPELRKAQTVYDAVRRCRTGCPVPVPHGMCLAPEVLR